MFFDYREGFLDSLPPLIEFSVTGGPWTLGRSVYHLESASTQSIIVIIIILCIDIHHHLEAGRWSISIRSFFPGQKALFTFVTLIFTGTLAVAFFPELLSVVMDMIYNYPQIQIQLTLFTTIIIWICFNMIFTAKPISRAGELIVRPGSIVHLDCIQVWKVSVHF